MATKTILELKVGDFVAYRDVHAEVLEVWHGAADAEPGVRQPHGCVIGWDNASTTVQGVLGPNGWEDAVVDVVTPISVRLVWPDLPPGRAQGKHVEHIDGVMRRPVPGCTDPCCDADAFDAELDRQIKARKFTTLKKPKRGPQHG